MRISINGVQYAVPREKEEKLLSDVLAHGTAEYAKVPKGWRIAGEALSRLVLKKIEENVAKIAGREAARAMRAPRNADKNLYLASLVAHELLEGLKHVELTICTDSGTIDAFNLIVQSPSATGGQVDSHRDIRIGQDNGAQIP